MKRAFRVLMPVAGVSLFLATLGAASAAPPTPEQVLGKRLFLRCAACHAVTPQSGAKIGPNLQGVVGRKAGALAGFNYSNAMRGANLVWNEANLDRLLQRPQAVVPGTVMAFAGLPKPEDRKALIAYLKKPIP
jgi:cytochrome c